MAEIKQKIRIATVQVGNVLANVEKNLNKHYEYIEKAIADGADVVVFPELSITGYSLKDAVYDVALTIDDRRFDRLKELSKKVSILIGAVELNERFEIYNSALWFEDGRLLTRHRKVYLPTYGLFEEKRYFSAGNRFRAFDSKLGRFGLLICEDMWHPTSGIILAQDGASVIFVMSAGIARGIGGDDKPQNIRIWETLNVALAVSTTSFIVFVNRVGVEDGLMFWGGSEVIDPHGDRITKTEYFQEGYHLAEIDLLKLKHARINTTLLSDEKLNVLIEEFDRIEKQRREY
ncbi:MAG TPA: hypothetical protein ENK44_14910 [Caldithrix abyssi]|uniref:CN hydrolase domain-containing protein n=1 Tax=Caldithrix abyssi TaxID=187145 RepID=A0A7V4U2R3_CALAY|nr:hypothetical protein [Caldithrix abyssi]